MLAIGELADRIGVPTHILRYWETRFPELKPLQRSGRRRYYRAEDVALVERIHALLHEQGFTVEGARRALSDDAAGRPADHSVQITDTLANEARGEPSGRMPERAPPSVDILALMQLRQRLARALEN